MPFNLRGGRPKNMRQGIYWVQRERSRSRARVCGELQALRFNNRYHRITSQFLSIFQPYAGRKGTIEVRIGSKIDQALDGYNDLKTWIYANIDGATKSHLSKLATAAKGVLVEIAKNEGWAFAWDTSSKALMIKDRKLDFS